MTTATEQVRPTKVLENIVTVFNEIKTNTNIGDKFLKVITCIVDVAKNTLSFFENAELPIPLVNLMGQFKVVNGLVSAFNLIDRVYDWVVPQPVKKMVNDKGEYYWDENVKSDNPWKSWNFEFFPNDPRIDKNGKDLNKNIFKANGYYNPLKSISKIFLTVAHAVEFVKFFETLDLFTLGAASSILGWVKSIAYIPASLFGIGSGIWTLVDNYTYCQKVAAKVDNWKNKIGLDSDGNYNAAERIQTYTDKQTKRNAAILANEQEMVAQEAKLAVKKNRLITAKNEFAIETDDLRKTDLQNEIDLLSAEIPDLEGKLPQTLDSLEVKNANLQEKVNKYAIFIQNLNDVQANATELEETTFYEFSAKKLSGWEKQLETAEKNKVKLDTKTWLDIVNNVGKLALGIIGIVGILLGFTMNPWFLVAVAAGWAITHAFNVAKEVYGNMEKAEPIVKPIVPIRGDAVSGYVVG